MSPTSISTLADTHQILEEAYNPAQFQDWGQQLVTLLANYLNQATQGAIASVLPYQTPEAQLADWALGNGTLTADQVMAWFEKAIQRSIHLHHPHYVGHQNPPTLPLAALCDLVDGVLNNPSAIYEMGPVSTAMETHVIAWMARHIGFTQQAGGILTSGGTLGNLTALLTAREVQCQTEGAKSNLAVLVSGQAHYSIARAVQVMGWGETGMVAIPVDSRFKFQPQDLEAAYQQAQSQGKKVIAVVGNACSTATGTYDDLQMMADFCERYGLWFHVDGAHGASALLSPQYRHMLAGIDRADSVVWDTHKTLLMPGLATGVIYRNGRHAYRTFAQKASYVFNPAEEDPWYNMGLRTFECTKKTLALKIYMALAVYGDALFTKYIDHVYGLAREFAQVIDQAPDFELAVMPESNIVCFRYRPSGCRDLDTLQAQIRERIVHSGRFYLVQVQLPQGLFMRCALMNPMTTLEHLTALLSEIRTVT